MRLIQVSIKELSLNTNWVIVLLQSVHDGTNGTITAIAAERIINNLDMGYLCLLPRPLCTPTDVYSTRPRYMWNFQIYLEVQFYDVLFCSGNEIVYIRTPEGYSFSWKLYGIDVRNLSTPPRTWYFLNSQPHDVSAKSGRSSRTICSAFCAVANFNLFQWGDILLLR